MESTRASAEFVVPSPDFKTVQDARPSVSPSFKDSARKQESLLAPIERRCLGFFARTLPAWIGPDHLTVLGFAAQLMVGVCYACARVSPRALLLANLFIALNWFGDSMDGTLARFRNKLRPRYGFYVDHITDTFGALFLICGLAVSGYVSERVSAIMLIGFLMLSVNVYLATYALGVFQLSYLKLSPTEMRILLIAGNIAAFYHPHAHLLGREYLLFDVGGVIGAASMGMILIVSSIRNTIKLYRMERV